jgi:hypothetical protein
MDTELVQEHTLSSWGDKMELELASIGLLEYVLDESNDGTETDNMGFVLIDDDV